VSVPFRNLAYDDILPTSLQESFNPIFNEVPADNGHRTVLPKKPTL
jgi:hypothetical protein